MEGAFYLLLTAAAAIAASCVALAVICIVVALISRRRSAGLIGFILALGAVPTCGITALPGLAFGLVGIRQKAYPRLSWTAAILSACILLFGVFAVALFVHAANSGPRFSTVPPTDTAATNAVRRTIGIREVKPQWNFYGRQFSGEAYGESWTGSGTARSSCKSVYRNGDGTIKWEEDYYDGVQPFVDGKGITYLEHLTVHYDYPSGKFATSYVGQDPAVLALTKGLRPTSIGDVGASNAATVAVADRILAHWKTQRL